MRFATERTEQLVRGMPVVPLGDGEVLVREGDPSDDIVYVVESGRLVATVATSNGDVVVGSVGSGEIVGEITMIAGGCRTATLTADGPASVHVVERIRLESLLSDDPELADLVSAHARARVDRSQVAAMVVDVLGVEDTAMAAEVADRVQWRHLSAGDVLFRQGDPSDAAYFVVSGRLSVTRSDTDGDTRVAELARGSVVGELGLLEDAPRSATVHAVRDTTLATLSAAAFEELVMRSPALMLHVARSVISRLRTHPLRSDRAAVLAVAVTCPGVDADQLVAGLVGELSRFGTVRELSSDAVDRTLNRPGIAQSSVDEVGVPRLTELLHEADVSSDHLVLRADDTLTAWTSRAVAHADRVLLVVSPQPDRVERQRIDALREVLTARLHGRLLLAVMHPRNTVTPHRTAALVATLGADEVVHLRAGSDAHIRRAARLAGGHGVGLVLSGGGARGFGHLGVYRALVEAGVELDAVAGCSMGAPMAGAIALEVPPDELLERAARQFRRLLDYTLPVVALLRGKRITALIEDNFGGSDIEDMWLPYFCVSTNLTSSRLEVHRRGPAARAIRASVAIPGVLPPVPSGDDLLVDGGVLNNLPAQVMRDDSRIGTVIAVDVAPRNGPRASGDFGLSVSGLRALRANRNAVAYPRLASVLMRSMMTGAVRNQAMSTGEGVVDLMIKLDMSGVGLLDFGRVREVAERGYIDSVGSVRDWAATRSSTGDDR